MLNEPRSCVQFVVIQGGCVGTLCHLLHFFVKNA